MAPMAGEEGYAGIVVGPDAKCTREVTLPFSGKCQPGRRTLAASATESDKTDECIGALGDKDAAVPLAAASGHPLEISLGNGRALGFARIKPALAVLELDNAIA